MWWLLPLPQVGEGQEREARLRRSLSEQKSTFATRLQQLADASRDSTERAERAEAAAAELNKKVGRQWVGGWLRMCEGGGWHCNLSGSNWQPGRHERKWGYGWRLQKEEAGWCVLLLGIRLSLGSVRMGYFNQVRCSIPTCLQLRGAEEGLRQLRLSSEQVRGKRLL